MSTVTFYTYALFKNNVANSGGALYLEQGTQLYFDDQYDSVTVQFSNNTATQYGGAIYTSLPPTCPKNGVMFHSQNTKNFTVYFMNNRAGIIGDSLYFNVQEFCKVYTLILAPIIHYCISLTNLITLRHPAHLLLPRHTH